ncbi:MULTISPECIES: methylmalonyl Co-A mutase-associated GTPase MeaB [unclassified Bacillus (in: firmicutes)]|uniref:methylmalonyl Co-A mutase-associated GTPase MeaB n=1 Tax=unclassified Bacillus (in: firmicutes) TaxID=185979 RepID=UPI0008E82CF9|nr:MULTISPECIES: methylmalonyl Co-A mutase-associated GTPase MeaB [unclassified Bacillus (in: firmicutes)]SFA97076.1 methylmalonyl-CoA mutase metallochaperone MeaB [Bacillus sp. UNCCL13]SFQ80261.1 methylmalonyl-CoA mutase metallochaperone MeaB [Bacillus sp. cl95]
MEQNKKRRIVPNRKNGPTLDELYEGVITQNRGLLARAITLIESNAEHHHQDAQVLLHKVLPHTGNSIRIGISGVPGAGKSTFIEAFGLHLCQLGHRVAVLAVDPSSSISGGSILGDKTRMEELSRNPHAFIRPSPTGGKLGGVHRKTKETILLCEAAGFDVILVETVGVGQSEVAIRGMVDFFMLLALTGAGDELQGMKKGIMEIADAIVVNKADGLNKVRSIQTAMEYNRILHFLQPATEGWTTKAFTCSAIEKEGISEIWNVVKKFSELGKGSGTFYNRRKSQSKEWVHALITDHLHFRFFHHPEVKQLLPEVEHGVIEGELTASSGVEQLIQVFLSSGK